MKQDGSALWDSCQNFNPGKKENKKSNSGPTDMKLQQEAVKSEEWGRGGGVMGAASTYPKSSREYMSAKEDASAPERRMKGGAKEGDYGGEGEALAGN